MKHMNGESTEPKKFSYPNADREQNDVSNTTGPDTSISSGLTQEQLRQTVHISEALHNEGMGQRPADMQNIRTFQSDIAGAVKEDNVSLIKIALAEKKRQERQGTFEGSLTPAPSNTPLLIGIMITLIVLGAGGFFFWKIVLQPNANTPVTPAVSTDKTPPFDAEQKITVNVQDKDFNDIERILEKERNSELTKGSVERVTFVKTDETGQEKQLSVQDWLAFLRAGAPNSLLRSFDPGFIFGIYASTPRDSFVIIKINSYDNAYAGMLQWEATIENDLGGVVRKQQIVTPSQAVATSTKSDEATTTQEAPTNFTSAQFVDKVINNKDTRILLDNTGKTKLIYSFVDQQTLVITSGEAALKEVIFRLTTGRIIR